MSEPTRIKLGLTECAAFGREMRTRREALNLSKQRAAHRSGVGFTRWCQIEQGYEHKRSEPGGKLPARPSLLTVKRIAAGLNWDLNEALTLAGFEPESNPMPLAPVVDDVNPDVLVAEVMELSPQQRVAARNLLRSMRNPNVDLAEAS